MENVGLLTKSSLPIASVNALISVVLPPPISPLNKITLYAALSIINFAAFLISSRL